MNKIIALALALMMLLTLAACGNTQSGGANTSGAAQQGQSDGGDVTWPSNPYINMIPKPENAVIYEEKEIDNVYYLGHRITFEKWNMEDCRAYAQKLQELGWTVPGTGADSVITTDTAEDFVFAAYNQDHVFVTIFSHAENSSGGIDIYNLKADLDEE